MNKPFLSVLFFIGLTTIIHAQDVRINEFMVLNKATLLDPMFNKYADWIELHNSTNSAIDLSGHYLTDNKSKTTKWKIPTGTQIAANGYLLFYPDDQDVGLHTSFKLSTGEVVGLYDGAAKKIDEIEYPTQFQDRSYGRSANGSWAYMDAATPGTQNAATSYTAVVDTFSILPAPGLYSSSQSVSMQVPTGATVHYTLDGSNPSKSSATYTKAFSVSQTTVVKAIAYQNDKLPSPISSQTYLFGVSHTLPVVNLTAENYSSIATNKPMLNIDGRVKFDFFESDGSVAISQYTDFAVSGNSSSSLPQLNGKLYSRKNYGQEFFNYKMFPNKSISKYKRFVLRNASQDYSYCHLRDGLFSRVISEGNLIDMPFEGYRPAALYVNGKYEGLINIREDDDKYYAETNHGQDPDTYEKMRPEGTSGIDIRTEQGRTEYRSWIDVRQQAFYYSLQAYSGAGEWGGRIWRDSQKKTQYQFHNHDFDQAFWLDVTKVIADPLSWAPLSRFDEAYKEEILQFFAAQINILYNKDRVGKIYDSVTKAIRGEMPRHITWNKTASTVHYLASMADWDNNLLLVKDFIEKRPAVLWKYTEDTYSVTRTKVTHSVNDSKMGNIAFHGVTFPEQAGTGDYFTGLPLRLEAVAKVGYIFSHWEGDLSSTNASVTHNLSGATTFKAVFKVDDSNTSLQKVKLNTPEIRYSSEQNVLFVTGDRIEKIYITNSKGALQGQYSVSKALSGVSLKGLDVGKYWVKVTTQNGIYSHVIDFQ